MTALSRFLRAGGAAILLIVANGCGLSEYQQRMDAQRVRVQEFDEVNRLLDDPIEMPSIQIHDKVANTKTESPAWPFEVYLRLPKGFGTSSKDKEPYYTNFSFFRYSQASAEPGYSVFVAAALITEPKTEEAFGVYTTESFRRYVRYAIEDFYFKSTKTKASFPDKVVLTPLAVKMISPLSDVSGRINYDTLSYSDSSNKQIKEPTLFRVYFHEDAGKQVCIVAQRPVRQVSETFDRSIEACLGTLDISTDASAKRAQYKKAKFR